MSSPDIAGLSVAVDQNEFLAEGASVVDAVLTVGTGPELAAVATPPPRLEILIIDCSGSMGHKRKFENARTATRAALDEIPDGTAFAIIEGTESARMIYPTGALSAPADHTHRTAAKRALDRLRPDGGTAMGSWLALARQVAAGHPGAQAHAILLTDGKNEHETPEQLAAELDRAEGLFVCDCRGVGADWAAADLHKISSKLSGGADIVADPKDLAADFAAMMRSSAARVIPELTLRVWTPAGARVRMVKQVAPVLEDLTGRRTDSGAQVGDYPLSSWAAEEREYHVQIELEPAAPGREKLAARLSVLAGEDVLGQGLVRAVWTTDSTLSTRISTRVAHYTGQVELAQAVQEGLAARREGDLSTATAKLRRAVELAAASGHESTAKLLRTVVEVDEKDGTVKLRGQVAAADELALDIRSTKTTRLRSEGS
ncbi:VWA domain-containing protein [Nocardia ignorata]|uniref:von Willebrand factor type A domain-containing protein n=1 Tax=Nocardia ignorata TaxID=145285 RepID=A0A4R6PUA4_NOCIG|nr:VWA domain-containing protein [Nocardia ignorata]TDP40906.1 von Willebrand factor type A domain-containing protein [Nocardia ignorata]